MCEQGCAASHSAFCESGHELCTWPESSSRDYSALENGLQQTDSQGEIRLYDAR